VNNCHSYSPHVTNTTSVTRLDESFLLECFSGGLALSSCRNTTQLVGVFLAASISAELCLFFESASFPWSRAVLWLSCRWAFYCSLYFVV